MHFSTLVTAFGATNLSCPRYHVLMDTFCPLCGPVMCGGIWIFTDDMLTILLPVSQEVILPFTTCFSSSTWITSPYLLKMSLSLSLFISTGTSYTITLVIAERESSWRFTLLPKMLSPSIKSWLLTVSFFNTRCTVFGHFCGYSCNPCTSPSLIIAVTFWWISFTSSDLSSIFNADLPISLILNLITKVSSHWDSMLVLSCLACPCWASIHLPVECPCLVPQYHGLQSAGDPHWGVWRQIILLMAWGTTGLESAVSWVSNMIK